MLKMSPCLLFRRFVILFLDSHLESLEESWFVEVPIKRLCVDRARGVVGGMLMHYQLTP